VLYQAELHPEPRAIIHLHTIVGKKCGALWGNCGGNCLQTGSACISTTISAAFNRRLITRVGDYPILLTLSFDSCSVTRYTLPMIRTLRHKGLKALYEGKRSAKVVRSHVPKLERILSALDEATGPHEMDIPGFRLHPLKGRGKGFFSVWVSGNWRVTFRFEGVDAVDVDYIDCH